MYFLNFLMNKMGNIFLLKLKAVCTRTSLIVFMFVFMSPALVRVIYISLCLAYIRPSVAL